MRIRAIGMACVAVAMSLAMSMGTVQVPAGRSSELRTSDHRGDVIVTAFQYNWRSVARECTQVLGPAGVGYVQVSPPQESILGSSWWTSYQPVSYALDSKEGTASEFRDMIRQCKAAGVGVVVDAVINHTTGVDTAQGVGTAGNTYTNTGDFPAVPYTSEDFHSCTENIMNYRDVTDVQECRVSGLQDLDTSSTHVRSVLAQYFATLLDLGVSGFRVDAVKHIAADDVLAIKRIVAEKTGRSIDDIWWMQEVIGNVNEAEEIQPDRYLRSGQVNEFQYAYRLKRLFDDSLMGGSLTLDEISSNLVSSSQASVFVTNWDTERDGSTLTYKDGDKYTLATAFMLAYPYGSVNVFSGYRFTDRDAGAPGATDDSVPDTTCDASRTTTGWTCFDRNASVIGMVGWHNIAGDAPVVDWQSDGDNVVGFGRGGRAFIVMNNSSQDSRVSYRTSLPAGRYCNVYKDAACSSTIRVGVDGRFSATVPTGSAVAFHIGSRARP